MCGISGYYNINQLPIKSNKEILDMLEVQRHRGPDDSGIVFFSLENKTKKEVSHKKTENLDNSFEGVLGFNRLSILDLSHNGHQPMTNKEENVILTLNGEIYNAFDYKEELVSDGYTFKGTSDTELVLYLYLKYGLDKMLDLLNGMFAVVIVDLRASEVYIARDRFGIKPMYYFMENNKIGFSSEIKSFYKVDGFNATLNKKLLDEFLIFRNTRNESLINEIKIIAPGHYITFNSRGEVTTKQFFDINNYSRDKTLPDEIESLKKDIDIALKKSVESQLKSDVRLGCQLSGGVDSSLVTYIANHQRKGQNFESVSIIFDNPNYSEEKYIDQVSNKLRIEAHKFKMDADYYLKHIKKATWHLENPINHPNTIGIYLLSQQAKKHVTVLLSGEGADEVFGGYSRFHSMKYRYKIPFFKGLIKNLHNPIKYLKNYQNIPLQTILGTAFMQLETVKKLKPSFNFNLATKPRLDQYNSLKGSTFDKQVKYEVSTYIPDLLIRQDKMSMAHSIENRVPFLDNNLVERSFLYPEEQMLKKEKNHEKFILKELCSDLYGRKFAYRDKMGFGIPLQDFFKDKEFTQYLSEQILHGLLKRDLFDKKELTNLFRKVNQLSIKDMDTLWILVTLEVWMQEFIDKQL